MLAQYIAQNLTDVWRLHDGGDGLRFGFLKLRFRGWFEFCALLGPRWHALLGMILQAGDATLLLLALVSNYFWRIALF